MNSSSTVLLILYNIGAVYKTEGIFGWRTWLQEKVTGSGSQGNYKMLYLSGNAVGVV